MSGGDTLVSTVDAAGMTDPGTQASGNTTAPVVAAPPATQAAAEDTPAVAAAISDSTLTVQKPTNVTLPLKLYQISLTGTVSLGYTWSGRTFESILDDVHTGLKPGNLPASKYTDIQAWETAFRAALEKIILETELGVKCRFYVTEDAGFEGGRFDRAFDASCAERLLQEPAKPVLRGTAPHKLSIIPEHLIADYLHFMFSEARGSEAQKMLENATPPVVVPEVSVPVTEEQSSIPGGAVSLTEEELEDKAKMVNAKALMYGRDDSEVALFTPKMAQNILGCDAEGNPVEVPESNDPEVTALRRLSVMDKRALLERFMKPSTPPNYSGGEGAIYEQYTSLKLDAAAADCPKTAANPDPGDTPETAVKIKLGSPFTLPKLPDLDSVGGPTSGLPELLPKVTKLNAGLGGAALEGDLSFLNSVPLIGDKVTGLVAAGASGARSALPQFTPPGLESVVDNLLARAPAQASDGPHRLSLKDRDLQDYHALIKRIDDPAFVAWKFGPVSGGDVISLNGLKELGPGPYFAQGTYAKVVKSLAFYRKANTAEEVPSPTNHDWATPDTALEVATPGKALVKFNSGLQLLFESATPGRHSLVYSTDHTATTKTVTFTVKPGPEYYTKIVSPPMSLDDTIAFMGNTISTFGVSIKELASGYGNLKFTVAFRV